MKKSSQATVELVDPELHVEQVTSTPTKNHVRRGERHNLVNLRSDFVNDWLKRSFKLQRSLRKGDRQRLVGIFKKWFISDKPYVYRDK